MPEPRPRVPCDCPACSGIEPTETPKPTPQYRSSAAVQIAGAFLAAAVIVAVSTWYGLKVLDDVSKW